jgi:heptosyltransferase-1
MNILFVKLSALGDVVQAIPAFESLRNYYSSAHITWLVEEEAADLLQFYPGLDEVMVCRRRSWLIELRNPLLWPKVSFDILRFCGRLRQRYYDLIIDLQGLLKSGIWVGLTRGRRKIGFDRTREGSWRFLNERLPPYDPDQHALERYLDVTRYLGAKVDSVRIHDPWTAAEEHLLRRRLSQIKPKSGPPLVACHPVSRWPTKLWPETNFTRLAAELVTRLQATVVFTGSTRDRDTIERIVKGAGVDGLHNWAGTTNLRELAYVCKSATVVVSTDSGPMHLAAALGTPVVALFGPTAPWRTGPYGEIHRVMRVDRDCSPCFEKSCDTVECMTALKVEDVLQAVVEQMNKE